MVLPIYLYTDEHRVRQRLLSEGFSDKIIGKRIERNEKVYNDYEEYMDENLITIINNSSRESFHRRINSLIKYTTDRIIEDSILYVTPNQKLPLRKEISKIKNKIISKLLNSSYNKNVLIMFNKSISNEKTFKYIKNKIEGNGYACIESDSNKWSITDDEYNSLAVSYCCKYAIIIFDESGYNLDSFQFADFFSTMKKDVLVIRHHLLPKKLSLINTNQDHVYDSDIDLIRSVQKASIVI